MQHNSFRVVVIPDLSKTRTITRTVGAQNATEAAGSVLLSELGGAFVDCIEVSQVQPGRQASGKVAFYACLYGMAQGFSFTERFAVARR